MKNSEQWRPTKFVRVGSRWRGSRDHGELAISSRITSDAAVRSYETFLRQYARGRLIDFGCGKAPLFGIHRELASDVVTVDWSQSRHGTDHVDVIADPNEPTPLPGESFDTLLSTSVVEHIRRPQGFFDEVARLLAPGGVAIISTPFLYPLHEVPHDYHRFTEFGLRALCDDSGLELVEIDRFGGLPEVIADLTSKLFGRPRLLAAFLVWTMQRVLGLGPVRRASLRSRPRFPLGYTLAARKPA